MGDNALQVEPPQKDKKKRKSSVKKSDLPKQATVIPTLSSEPVPPPVEVAEARAGGGTTSLAPEQGQEVGPTNQGERRGSTRATANEMRQKSTIDLQELDNNKLMELKELFELFDLNHDGFIDLDDLKMTFRTLGREDVSDEELKTMLSEASNPLDFDSFVMLLGFKTLSLDPEETIRKALSTWDYDASGFISEERVKHDLMTWGDKFNQAEAESAFQDAPTLETNGQSMIDYVTFCKTLGGLRKKAT